MITPYRIFLRTSGFVLVLLQLFLFTCKKEETITKPQASITTLQYYDVLSQTSLRLNGKVTFFAGGTFSDHGHAWSAVNPKPTLDDNFSALGPISTSGTFNTEIKDLEYGQLYYVRSYAREEQEIIYGQVTQVSTAWQPKTNFGGGSRRDGLLWVIGDKIFLGLGSPLVTEGPSQTDLWSYDPSTDSWTEEANFPGTPREEPFCFVINGKGYVGGGLIFSDNDYKYQPDFYEYEPETNKWTQKNSLQWEGDFYSTPVSMSIDGQGYVFLEDSLYQYNPVKDQWSMEGEGARRTFATGFSLNDHAYVVTGVVPNTHVSPGTLLEFDVKQGKKKTLSYFPGTPLVEAVSFILDGSAYVGCGSPNTQFTDSKGEFWKYESATDTWSSVPALPVARQGAFAAVVGNRAFVGLGGDIIAPRTNTQNYYFKNYSDWWEYLPK